MGLFAEKNVVPVVIYDEAGNPVSVGAQASAAVGNSAVASVGASVNVTTLLAANAARRGAMVFNDSTAVLMLKLGPAASSSSYTVQVPAGGYYEVPFGYAGIVTGVWAAANGSARVTEVS